MPVALAQRHRLQNLFEHQAEVRRLRGVLHQGRTDNREQSGVLFFFALLPPDFFSRDGCFQDGFLPEKAFEFFVTDVCFVHRWTFLTSLSFVETICLVEGMFAETPVSRFEITLEIRVGMSFCLGAENLFPSFRVRTHGMGELLDPFVDTDGRRWYDPTSAAKRLGHAVTAGTLAVWAERGTTTFGLPVESMRVPLRMTSHHSEGSSYKPLRPRTDRPVISEETVAALDAIFREVFRDMRRYNTRGSVRHSYSKDEKAKLESATRRYPALQLTLFHL
jgi:hypothetical protein